jgi:hypothetical protein
MQEMVIANAILNENASANEIVSVSEVGNSGQSPRAFDFAHRVCRELYEAKVTASSRQTFRQ